MTIGVDAKGNRKEIFSADVAEKKQKSFFNLSKTGELQKGIVAVEMWQRIRHTTGIDVKLRDARLKSDGGAHDAVAESNAD